MAGGRADIDTVIDHLSWMVTETKNVVGENREIVKQMQSQTKLNIAVLIFSVLTFAASVAAIVISITRKC